ncbi:MAG: MBL fold metallo-hydrolase [Solirubrobacteraceae bacterium]|nr:MBL fold metallo-hydrolase [Solirubrobacteraceae bacterium]
MSAAEPIADGLWRLSGDPGHCNVFLLRDGDGVLAFDAGGRTMARGIRRATDELGGLTGIVLGHGHTDHRGAAPGLGVPVRCHPDAVEEAEGRGGWDYWDPHLGFLPLPIRLIHRLLHRFAWDGGPVDIAGTVSAGDEVAAGFVVVEIPGHAPGQIALWREADRVALTTDAFYVTDMWGRPTVPAMPVEGYSQDPELARRSVQQLADLEPLVCWPGHGDPVRADAERGTVADQLRAAAAA